MSLENIVKACLEQQKKEQHSERFGKLEERQKYLTLNIEHELPDEMLVQQIVDLFQPVIVLHEKEKHGYHRTETEHTMIEETKNNLRNIGFYLWDDGGETRMSRVLDMSRLKIGRVEARLLEMWWNGIGTWMG